MMPRVVRIRKRGGILLQGYDCYIGRAVKRGGWNLDASIWANPFKRKQGLPPGSTLHAYEQYVRSNPVLMHAIPSLAGKTLGCWCKPDPCHGDVLVNLVKEHFETEEFEALSDVIEDSTSEDSEQTNHLQHNKPTSCVSLEGVIIGATFIKKQKQYVCVMAISGGQLIRPLPQINIMKSHHLASVGTKFRFTEDVDRMRKCKLPHSHEDAPINITGIDPKPVCSKLLHQVISSCAVSKKLSESSQKLVELLAGNQKHGKTPYVFEGDDVCSSIIIKVESDVVIYCKEVGRNPRAQIRVLGNEFHLPVTSIGIIEMFMKTKEKKLTLKQENVYFVRMSLARPFLPWLSSHLDKPRCYATLTGGVLSVNNVVTIV